MDFLGNDNNKNNKEMLAIFQGESEEILERLFNNLFSLEDTPANKDLIGSIYRDLHSLKGAVRMVGFNNIQGIFHKMEDIFDAVNNDQFVLDKDIINLMSRSLETASRYLQESIKNGREIIDEEFTATLSNLEYILDIEMNEQTFRQNETIAEAGMAPREESSGLSQYQEEINSSFNACFEIIDSIVPEEESQDIVILKEEVEKIYEFFKNSNLYEVKTSLENILAKLDFVMNATNTFTISEILELRNELSSAAAKFTTSCIETEEGGLTFFDIAEKISMLQGSSIYAKEIKDDIAQLKEGVDDQNIIEIINVINDILDFISENSVQLEEQMMMTLKGAVEYCASPNENIDNDLILQQLEIMKQLLELNYKKDTGVSEIKSLSTQTSSANKSNASTEIKTLHVNAQKLDLLVNQLGELIITKIKTEKNLEKIDSIKNANEACQKDLLKTSNYLRYYNRKYLQSGNTDQYTGVFVKQVFSLLLDITQNVSRTIYDLNSLYRASKEDDMKMRLIIDEMESMVKNIRVLPISTVFNSFSRMVRDIANEKGKDIDFEIEGKDTCADKKIIEEIKTPLIHILRNAIDHGIESKEERIANGKSPVGKILLSAKQDDNKVIIDVVDDGQGFNLEKIKDRAVSRGFLTQDDIDSMTDEAIMNIIFWPGFTTGDSITSISGRGIGLDVVKTKISQLNGKVKVISEFGKGSCVHIEIPVTLTTLRVFLVQISGQTFAIPIQVITTFILKNQNEIKTNNGIRSILFNGNIIPLYYLSDILELAPAPRNEKETILIIEADDKTIGLVVDKLLGDQDILQKKLSPPLYKVKNISGITNLASGELCLILNMQDIMHYDFNKAMISANNQELLTSDVLSYKRILIVDDSVTTRTMVKNILLNIGYMVDTVLDADEALVKLKLTHYDLIITDLTMPKIDGYEFIERLRNDEMYADIPIIVISSLPENQARKRLNKLSIAHYISKDNFDQADLAMQVKEILTKFHH
ncbi:TPA: hybrid sensor histidine kinase/response regulator [Candidatus Gastranaerophilales bacterium HUM_8]|nr:cheA signal transduction histidine kinase [Acinetobacter sp. CAG:196]DAA94314.1 MAG TPA: hybrid sensor histidine kinase/response regulator [Candidatus Gastranaerophilales bacterium HUM_8]